jgi:predicted NBD/HSP70 family sugar kinase
MAGNLGHISLEEAEVLCSCGHKGCLQAVSSGRGMIQTFKERNSISAETVEDIVLLAEKGCVPAKNILENSVKSLAKVLTDTIKILDIPLIIIGGGVVHAYPLLGNELETRINFLLRSYNQQVAVKVSVLGDYNCAIGALYLNE